MASGCDGTVLRVIMERQIIAPILLSQIGSTGQGPSNLVVVCARTDSCDSGRVSWRRQLYLYGTIARVYLQ